MPDLPTVDPAPWLDVLVARYGFDPALFADYAWLRTNRKRLSLAVAELDPPDAPEPDSMGVYVLRTYGTYPKLTTAAAMLFGAHATRHVVDVDRPQANDYVSRTPFTVTPAQAARCTSRGHVLVRHRELTLGVASFEPGDDGGGTIHSMFPKTWAGIYQPSALDASE